VLKPAAELLTTREVVLAILRANGVAEPTAKQVRDLYGGVQSSLRSCNGKSVALSVGGHAHAVELSNGARSPIVRRAIVEPSAGCHPSRSASP
jgi:hypothetical protein